MNDYRMRIEVGLLLAARGVDVDDVGAAELINVENALLAQAARGLVVSFTAGTVATELLTRRLMGEGAFTNAEILQAGLEADALLSALSVRVPTAHEQRAN